MADQYKKPYFDSSVFIAWIRGEIINGINRKQIADHILTLAENGEFKIHSSSFTLAEVHKKRNHEKLTTEQDENIILFFEQEFIEVIDVDRLIGEEANRLCRQYGLLPADAIHLASALRAGCDVLLAWDDRVTKVSHSDIRIEEPQIIGQTRML